MSFYRIGECFEEVGEENWSITIAVYIESSTTTLLQDGSGVQAGVRVGEKDGHGYSSVRFSGGGGRGGGEKSVYIVSTKESILHWKNSRNLALNLIELFRSSQASVFRCYEIYSYPYNTDIEEIRCSYIFTNSRIQY